MMQPRLSTTWAYNGKDTLYASYAAYNPAASSLPRAASWDRNLAREIFAYFDANGNFIGVDPVRSSSGKFFADDLDPRAIDEYLIGTTRQFTGGWSANAYARYRYGYNFWEDTNNDARVRGSTGPRGDTRTDARTCGCNTGKRDTCGIGDACNACGARDSGTGAQPGHGS